MMIGDVDECFAGLMYNVVEVLFFSLRFVGIRRPKEARGEGCCICGELLIGFVVHIERH